MNDNWKKIALTADTLMREVMAAIDVTAMQIALIVDQDYHLLGTVTDGDIRRALLKGSSLDTPAREFMNSNPISGIIDEDPESWQRALQRHQLRHLPLLDANGCVRALAKAQLPKEPRRENHIILMAGGLGTRLRPLTEKIPKPLLRVGDKPILQTIIENFAAQGFYRFTLCLNYQGEKIQAFCGDGSQWGVNIRYVTEDRPLGTAGALSLISEPVKLPFFVMNGDLLTKVDFVRLLGFHEKQNNAATMCVREYRYQIPYGVVKLDEHRIISIKEKPIQYYYVNAGIYLLAPEILSKIPKKQYFDMTDLYSKLIDESQRVGSFPLREYWMDVGRMEDFEQAGSDYLEQFG